MNSLYLVVGSLTGLNPKEMDKIPIEILESAYQMAMQGIMKYFDNFFVNIDR